MEQIENSTIGEKIYKEILDNGLTIYLMPKETKKKYVIWSTKFGSVDNKFYSGNDSKMTVVPDGIAHYCEHKLFEQRDGTNSLDTLTALGVDANAYTTNDHTAYLFECTENFDEALDEFMDYVQNPFFTDENVEKERGIIGQEIMMYDDYPDWKLYMNLMKAMYEENEINIDTAGTVETIQDIDKDSLYQIYNAFYVPQNMIMVCVGGFEVDDMLNKIKNRMTMKKAEKTLRRVYNSDSPDIVKSYIEENKEISIPLVSVGFKDMYFYKEHDGKTFISEKSHLNESQISKEEGIELAKRDMAVDMLGDIIFGPCSEFYKRLYESGIITTDPSVQYEFSDNYGHVMIQIQTNHIDEFVQEVKNELSHFIANGISDDDFNRTLRCEYSDIIRSFNEVSGIGNMLVSQICKGIEPFGYIDAVKGIDKDYIMQVLNEIFMEKNMVVSVIKVENKNDLKYNISW